MSAIKSCAHFERMTDSLWLNHTPKEKKKNLDCRQTRSDGMLKLKIGNTLKY